MHNPLSKVDILLSPHFSLPTAVFSQALFLHFGKKEKSKQLEDFQRSLVSLLLLYDLWVCAFQTINNTFSSKNLSQWSYIDLFLSIQAISEANIVHSDLQLLLYFTYKFYSAFVSIPLPLVPSLLTPHCCVSHSSYAPLKLSDTHAQINFLAEPYQDYDERWLLA